MTRLLGGVDLLPDTSVAVVVNNGAGLLVVGTETLAESALVVVGTLDQRLAGDIVDHGGLRGVEDLVVRATRCGVDEATGDTGDKELVGDLELNSVLEGLGLGLEHAVELDSLGNSAREAIEDEAEAYLLVLWFHARFSFMPFSQLTRSGTPGCCPTRSGSCRS